jgi:hypothetical protein
MDYEDIRISKINFKSHGFINTRNVKEKSMKKENIYKKYLLVMGFSLLGSVFLIMAAHIQIN